MKKIFITTLYRSLANDYWGFALSEDAKFLAEESATDMTWVKLLLGLDGSESNHDVYRKKYPEGYLLVYIPQYEFETNTEFKQVRIRSLHQANELFER